MENIRIVSDPREDSADAAFFRDDLALFNVATTENSYYGPLAIFLRDERGAVLSGALGHVWGGWLDLASLGIAEPLCGQGYGEKLLEADARGCRGVQLTTFSFRARSFYERPGYEVVAGIPDNPAGHTYHVSKSLQGA